MNTGFLGPRWLSREILIKLIIAFWWNYLNSILPPQMRYQEVYQVLEWALESRIIFFSKILSHCYFLLNMKKYFPLVHLVGSCGRREGGSFEAYYLSLRWLSLCFMEFKKFCFCFSDSRKVIDKNLLWCLCALTFVSRHF